MKAIGRVGKIGSIASTTIMSSSLLQSNMPYLQNADLIGAGVGLGVGVLIAHFIERLEDARQAIPIVVIGGLLAFGGYQEAAKMIHDKNLNYELSKQKYSYTYNMRRLEALVYNEDGYTKELLAYDSSTKKIIDSNNEQKDNIKSFIKSKESFIEEKARYLMKKKYDRNGNRTSYYNHLIAPYLGLAKKYKVVTPPSSNKIKSKEDWVAVASIAEVMYFVELDKLKESFGKIVTNDKKRSMPKSLTILSEEYVNKLRSQISIAIEKDITLANRQVDSVETLKWKGIIIGLISEVILAPILLWIELLREVPNPFKKRSGISLNTSRREDKIENSLNIVKEDIVKEVASIERLAAERGIKITDTLKRIIHVSLDIFGEDLSKMIVVKSKKNSTNLIVFDGVKEKNNYLALSNKERTEELSGQEREYLSTLKKQIVTADMFASKNGDVTIFPQGESFKKPFNNAIRVMKQIVSHYNIEEKASIGTLEIVLLDTYKGMKF